MKATESFDNGTVDSSQHGSDGPMYIQSVINTHREYPLRQQVLESWEELGVEPLPNLDADAGNPLGVGDLCENRRQGRREIASVVYPLDGITVLTDTMVAKVLVEQTSQGSPYAKGIQLANGTDIFGNEIILSAGAIRTPQLLMLSGIGPADELAKHDINVIYNAPEVGKNLADHGMFAAMWEIKDPSAGYAIGSGNPLFLEPQYGLGLPADFIVSTGVQDMDGLAKAIEADEGVAPDPNTHPLLTGNRTFEEHFLEYAGEPNGSAVTFVLIDLLPTSRGSVTLVSANISDVPLIDPNYFATEVDKFVLRDGLRRQIQFAGSNSTIMGRDILDGELGAPGFNTTLTVNSTDEYIDSRLQAALGYVVEFLF